jgi:hypothetical protein
MASLGGPERREDLYKALLKLGIELQPEEKALQGKDFMKCVMPKFLPLSTVQLPSPIFLALLGSSMMLTHQFFPTQPLVEMVVRRLA